MATVYLASPLGFDPVQNGDRMAAIVSRLEALGHVVVNPWDADFGEAISSASSEEDFRAVARTIGHANALDVARCDTVLAVLDGFDVESRGMADGMELDSGTVAELAFAAGSGKTVYALRTDAKDAGDFPGVPFNLQVLYFIEASGGKLFRAVEDIAL